MISKIKNFIKLKLNRQSLIQNINLDLTTNQKKVLISYLTTGFENDIENGSVSATNIFEVNQIVKSFISFNFSIDIVLCVDINSFNKIKDKNYDIIFGFGEIFNRMCKLQPSKKRIMYLTEHHPEFSKKKETERVRYFYERHNKNISLSRSGAYFQKDNFNHIDEIIILGETFPFENKKYKIHKIKPTGLLNNRFTYSIRNINSSRNNFLWFGSNGAVHKGLDLLLDIFLNRPEISLHICGLNKQDRKLLKLPKQANIIDYGKIDVQGDLFLKLMKNCSFILLPSCSEGMSTSVLTCMRHSMIPIVMKDTGFNHLTDLAFLLDDFKLDYVENRINQIRSIDEFKIENLHKKIYKYANDEFNLKKYSIDISSIISKL